MTKNLIVPDSMISDNTILEDLQIHAHRSAKLMKKSLLSKSMSSQSEAQLRTVTIKMTLKLNEKNAGDLFESSMDLLNAVKLQCDIKKLLSAPFYLYGALIRATTWMKNASFNQRMQQILQYE